MDDTIRDLLINLAAAFIFAIAAPYVKKFAVTFLWQKIKKTARFGLGKFTKFFIGREVRWVRRLLKDGSKAVTVAAEGQAAVYWLVMSVSLWLSSRVPDATPLTAAVLSWLSVVCIWTAGNRYYNMKRARDDGAEKSVDVAVDLAILLPPADRQWLVKSLTEAYGGKLPENVGSRLAETEELARVLDDDDDDEEPALLPPASKKK